MFLYFLRRLGFLLLTLFLTSVLVFVVTQWLPGDVARVLLGREAGEAALEALRVHLGLNDPLPVQYMRWVGNLAIGDWGRSFSTDTAVLPLVAGRLRNSLWLAAVTLLMAVPLAVILGVVAGLREDGLLDNTISILALAVVGLPEFVTGLILVQVLSFGLRLLPAVSIVSPEESFLEVLPRLVLPALTASLVLLAYVARHTRAGVAEELKKTYVRTAILQGLPHGRVVVQHVLRNALLPTITVIAISVGWLISGLVVVESVFNYPGIGRLLIFAIERRDLPLIQAITMVTVVAYAGANLMADLLYGVLDPRIRLGE